MFIDLQSLLRGPRAALGGKPASRRRREDRASRARLVAPPPSPYSSGFVNELGSWCGVEQNCSQRGTTYVWIPWVTAQVRRFR
jgi:hypothetical protein